MKKQYSTKVIKVAALVAGVLFSLALILFHMNQRGEATQKNEINTPFVPNNNTSEEGSYDPLSELKNANIYELNNVVNYNYAEEIAKLPTVSQLSKEGYTHTSEDFNGSTTKLGILTAPSYVTAEYSLKKEKTNKPVTTEGKKGGYTTTYESVSTDVPQLLPYYGYIIYTSKSGAKLLDSNGSTLVNDFTGYIPAYKTDLIGNPLFIKDGSYYYYYSAGDEDKNILLELVKPEEYLELPEEIPTGYWVYYYDYNTLLNDLRAGSFNALNDVVYEHPMKAGMVKYNADPLYIDTLVADTAYTYDENAELFPFCRYVYEMTEKPEPNEAGDTLYEIKVTKTLWGYLDKKGNIAIESKFKRAYPFSKDGYATVVDENDHVCIINKQGSVVYNPYSAYITFEELGQKWLRDGFYNPDTYGIESLGLFRFDFGYTRVRRKLVDTAYGYIVKKETQELVNYEGKRLNIPQGYQLLSYSDGMLLLEKNGLYGYMDYTGDWIVEPKLAYANPFSEGLAVVGYAKGKLGVIDTKGNVVLPYMYTEIEPCSGGIITAFSHKNGWTVYKKMTTNKPAKKEEESVNPVLYLKRLAIAQAKYDYQN